MESNINVSTINFGRPSQGKSSIRVNFLNFMLSSNPDAFSQNRHSDVGEYVTLNKYALKFFQLHQELESYQFSKNWYSKIYHRNVDGSTKMDSYKELDLVTPEF